MEIWQEDVLYVRKFSVIFPVVLCLSRLVQHNKKKKGGLVFFPFLIVGLVRARQRHCLCVGLVLSHVRFCSLHYKLT